MGGLPGYSACYAPTETHEPGSTLSTLSPCMRICDKPTPAPTPAPLIPRGAAAAVQVEGRRPAGVAGAAAGGSGSGCSSALTLPLLILVAQQRSIIINHTDSKLVKFIATMYDRCQVREGGGAGVGWGGVGWGGVGAVVGTSPQ